MARWWWFGVAATRDEIERELAEMQRQGIGGVELQPVYPLTLDDTSQNIRNVPYLSDEWRELMLFAVRKARELGIRFDATFGSGWPFGGPHVRAEQSAKRLRCVFLDVAHADVVRLAPPVELDKGETAYQVIACPVRSDGTVEIDRRVFLPRSRKSWTAPKGHWRVMWFLNGHTLQQVKRPALGAEGLVIDHYDRRAFDAHAAVVGKAYSAVAQEAGSTSIRAMFCDSWEVYGANWTDALPSAFRRTCGYDLMDYLPALWMNVGPDTARIRWDYRRTLSALALEQFFRPFAEWCEDHRFLARVQAHGTPGDLIEGYGTAHVPEGESYGPQVRFQAGSPGDTGVGDGPYHRTFAASAAAIFGRPICSCESYTWLRMPRFLETLEDIKAATDVVLCQGVNQIVCHGYPYSPPDAGIPGWVFYAGSMVNHNNTWWPYFRHVSDYIARACWLLRQGKPASDVCVYAPTNDVWAESEQPPRSSGAQAVERLDPGLLRSLREWGYQYDFVNDLSLANRADIRGSTIRVGAAEYRAVVVPAARRIDPKAMAAIADFARAGGTVAFAGSVPDSSCSFIGRDEGDAEVQRLAAEAIDHGALQGPASRVGEVLTSRIEPSLTIHPPDVEVGFRHRRMPGADICFIANVSPRPKRLTVELPGRGRSVTMWNAEDGTVYGLPAGTVSSRGFALALREFQSVFVVAADEAPPALPVWQVAESQRIVVVELDAGWRLQAPENASQVALERLVSWTELPGLAHYSGRGLYTVEFEAEPHVASRGQEVWLELGDVREIAEVALNGSAVGVTWKRPHAIEIGKALRPGRNCLEVVVTNLLINRVLGQPDPDYTELNARYGARFGPPREKELAQPVPSGLLGPVRLVVARQTRRREQGSRTDANR